MQNKNFFKRIAKRAVNRAASPFWTARKRLGFQPEPIGLPKFAAVILSYKRMENIQRIVDALLACDFVDEIVVSNNNPDVRMGDYLRTCSARVRMIDQAQRCFASIRFELARELRCDHFVFIDDDIFLSPTQITVLAQHCAEDGRRLHGISGHSYQYEPANEQFVAAAHSYGIESEVDVLHEVYTFTRAHLDTYFELVRRLDLPEEQSRICDDIFLSFSADSCPQIHDLGRILKCESWDDPLVALHQLSSFDRIRNAVFTMLARDAGEIQNSLHRKLEAASGGMPSKQVG